MIPEPVSDIIRAVMTDASSNSTLPEMYPVSPQWKDSQTEVTRIEVLRRPVKSDDFRYSP